MMSVAMADRLDSSPKLPQAISQVAAIAERVWVIDLRSSARDQLRGVRQAAILTCAPGHRGQSHSFQGNSTAVEFCQTYFDRVASCSGQQPTHRSQPSPTPTHRLTYGANQPLTARQ